MSASGFDHHNHAKCIQDGLASAEGYCAENKLKLTPVRRRVLELLLSEHKALGAYDVLAVLAKEGLGSQPPIAYRALDFLLANGFVHKVEKLNAYVACAHPGADHSPTFMICRSCDSVAEAMTKPLAGRLGAVARDVGFAIERAVVEAEGLCPNCQTDTQ